MCRLLLLPRKDVPPLVAINSSGQITGQVMDFGRSFSSLIRMCANSTPTAQWERLEMCSMSRASEISANVWLGPTPDYMLRPGVCGPPKEEHYDLLIEASDLASIPGPRYLAMIDKQLEDGPQRIEFPSSGSMMLPSGNTRELEDLVSTLRWIYYVAHPEPSEEAETDGDVAMTHPGKKPRTVFIHCADGYTESTLLAVAYFMFAEGVPAHEAWLRLHCNQKRNFFAYPTDVSFLRHVQPRLLQESPANRSIITSEVGDPDWFLKVDGSLPSRILPYLYLGNLKHANNPELLRKLGIRRVLSIGEPVCWCDDDHVEWGSENLMYVDNVQDNGIDPLWREIHRCLGFIGESSKHASTLCGSSMCDDLVPDCSLQRKERRTAWQPWFTAVLVFPDPLVFALPR